MQCHGSAGSVPAGPHPTAMHRGAGPPSDAEGGRCSSFRYSPVNSNWGHSSLLYSPGSTSAGARGMGQGHAWRVLRVGAT